MRGSGNRDWEGVVMKRKDGVRVSVFGVRGKGGRGKLEAGVWSLARRGEQKTFQDSDLKVGALRTLCRRRTPNRTNPGHDQD